VVYLVKNDLLVIEAEKFSSSSIRSDVTPWTYDNSLTTFE
jgi:hypothetical protein